MNEQPTHGHVTSLCRNCLDSDVMAVLASLEKANQFMYDLPQEFERMADKLPAEMQEEQSILRNVIIRRYEEDVYRVHIGSHDLVITSTKCHEDFEACRAAFQQFQMMKSFERQAKRALAELFGIPLPTEESNTPPKEEQPDRSFNILNQLDLPEDFFGSRGPN